MAGRSDFMNNSGVPSKVMDTVFDMHQKRSSRERKHAVNDMDVWEDNDFPGAMPGRSMDDDDDINENVIEDDDDSPAGGNDDSDQGSDENAGDLGALREILDEIVDQQRMLANNVASMELNISSIEKIIKSSGQDMNLSDVVDKLKDTLEVSSSANFEQLERKFAYFRQENIRELFDQIDQKLRVLNERNKTWQTELQKASDALGKKVVLYSFVFGASFAVVISICFIMFYGAIQKILPAL